MLSSQPRMSPSGTLAADTKQTGHAVGWLTPSRFAYRDRRDTWSQPPEVKRVRSGVILSRSSVQMAATPVQGPGDLARQVRDFRPVPVLGESEPSHRQYSWKSGVQMLGRSRPASTAVQPEKCWRASRTAQGIRQQADAPGTWEPREQFHPGWRERPQRQGSGR